MNNSICYKHYKSVYSILADSYFSGDCFFSGWFLNRKEIALFTGARYDAAKIKEFMLL